MAEEQHHLGASIGPTYGCRLDVCTIFTGPPSRGSTVYMVPCTLWLTKHLGFCSFLVDDGGATPTVLPQQADNILALASELPFPQPFIQHMLSLWRVRLGVALDVQLASLDYHRSLVHGPTVHQWEGECELQTANNTVNTP